MRVAAPREKVGSLSVYARLVKARGQQERADKARIQSLKDQCQALMECLASMSLGGDEVSKNTIDDHNAEGKTDSPEGPNSVGRLPHSAQCLVRESPSVFRLCISRELLRGQTHERGTAVG
jgi:hypothetical protein